MNKQPMTSIWFSAALGDKPAQEILSNHYFSGEYKLKTAAETGTTSELEQIIGAQTTIASLIDQANTKIETAAIFEPADTTPTSYNLAMY